jgi:hypothetical protein
MSEVLDEQITVRVTHVGGPWDGLEETRQITKTQTEFVIGQQLASYPTGGMAYLHHRYFVQIRGGVRLIYRGATPSATH